MSVWRWAVWLRGKVTDPGDARVEPAVRRHRMPINGDNAFWQAGVDRGELLTQRCRSCRSLRYPPAPMCGECQSMDWEAIRMSGRGTIYSYVVHHRPVVPGFESPYVILLVELEEGIRVLGNLVDSGPERVRIGQSVHVVFRADRGDDYVLPHWRLADAAA